MKDVFVVSAVRTPVGRYGGSLATVRPDDLATRVIDCVLGEGKVPKDAVEHVMFGAANQSGEDNRNVARMAALMAGLPVRVSGVTVNRLCASGLQAVVSAAREIQVGAADVVVAGGVESMTRAPYVLEKPGSAHERGNKTMYDSTLGWRMVNPRLDELYPAVSLGETAENVAREYGVSREDQDEWAFRSHERAINAANAGIFRDEIVPVHITVRGSSDAGLVAHDEGPRTDTSREKLARLKPAFVQDGSVTAGNSSQISDGAAAVVLASSRGLEMHGLRPLARFVESAAVGVDPAFMGMGPVPATQILLSRASVALRDIDRIEINEAFASQVLACIRQLDLDDDIVNVHGGAIALGHPLGASGARLVTTLIHELKRSGLRRGLVTMCVGVGQGMSALFESV